MAQFLVDATRKRADAWWRDDFTLRFATINGLPGGFRTVFVLRDVEGLSTEETAEALNLSIPAVKSRLLRARLQLRERLNKYFKQQRNGDTKK